MTTATHEPMEALRGHLIDASGVTSLLGATTHVFVGEVPPATAGDYVVLHQLDDPRIHHLTGPSSARRTLVQVECWARGQGAARKASQIALAIEATLDTFRGRMGALWVHGAMQQAKRGPLREDAQDGSEASRFYVQIDFAVTSHVAA